MTRLQRIFIIVITLSALPTVAETTRAQANISASIACSADVEGHTAACDDCPIHAGLGGLDRRATLLAQLRQRDAALVVVDSGNWLAGPGSLATRGQVMIGAYGAMQYDAANLSWRDLRFGIDATREQLSTAKFAIVSANLVDERSGELLVRPFVIRQLGEKKLCILGLSEAPAGIDFLPHLKQQLAGIKIESPADALAKWLPKAKAESDSIVLLYYGSARQLGTFRERFGADLSAILVGGVRPDELPKDAKPPIVAVEEHGKFIAKLELPAGQVEQIAVDSSLGADPSMLAVLAQFETKTVQPPPAQAAAEPAKSQAVSAETAQTTPFPAITPAAQLQPKGLAGVGLTAEQVNKAIDHGSEFLWNYIKTADLKRDYKLGDEEEHLLCCLALVHANAHKRFPDFDAALKQYLASVDFQKLGSHRTYQSGLLSMLVESYGDATYIPKLRMAARYLLEAQGPRGTWSYSIKLDDKLVKNPQDERALQVAGGVPLEGPGSAGEPWQRITPLNAEHDGDNSNTQYAILGLNSAARTGIIMPADAWKRNLTETVGGEYKDGGGFGYNSGGSPYGAMTCAGICMIAIDRHWLGEKDFANDPAIARGVAWLDANFSVEKHPHSHEWLYYYLYSLERVGRILDTEFIGTHEWYPLGARYLVDAQKPDGSWVGANREQDPRLATSFSLLFLTRATPTLNVALKRGGSGTLKTTFIPRSTRLYIILDASGSMLDEMDGKMKFEIARDAVNSLVNTLPDSTQVALRVYGSKKRAIEPGANADTALEIPLGPLDRKAFTAKLASLRARGKTPLARSLKEAAADLKSESAQGDRVTVLLLTDGGEDTQPREDPLKAAAEFGALKNVALQIVGFDINREDWSAQLAQMAQLAHAQYWSAEKAAMLQAGLRGAVVGDPEEFEIVDKSGATMVKGKFGQSLNLPEGKYALRSSFGGQPFNADFWINTDATTAVTFDARKIALPERATVAPTLPTAPPQPPQQPPAAASPTAAKFCTHCGKPLPPNSKFCPSCGAKVE